MVRRAVRWAGFTAAAAWALAAAPAAQAAQHFFHLSEIFTNEDGSIQFLEFLGEAQGQGEFTGRFICAGDPQIPAGQPGRQCFGFTMDLSSQETLNRSLLFGSRGYVDFATERGLPQPDFVLEGPSIDPAKPFFDPKGDTIDFLPNDSRTSVIIFPEFVTDGTRSFNGPFSTRSNANMLIPMNLGVAVITPTNFSRQSGTLSGPGLSPPVDVDSDADGLFDRVDNCPSLRNADQLDTDRDGVGDACDNCVTFSNPRVSPSPGHSATGGQTDDDGDGFGNQCDADVVGQSAMVDAADLQSFMTALGKLASGEDCGLSGTESCARFDVYPGGLRIDEEDLRAFSALMGRAPGPKCPSCPLACMGPACVR